MCWPKLVLNLKTLFLLELAPELPELPEPPEDLSYGLEGALLRLACLTLPMAKEEQLWLKYQVVVGYQG
jgi:hypothetical protein